MPKRWFVLVLVCLGLLETGILAFGYLGKRSAILAPTSTGPLPEARHGAVATPTLYLEPEAGFTWLYTLINNAKTSIDMTMYELVDPTASADLVAACGRGVKVRVILDQNLERAANTPAYNQLAAAGPNCAVAWANPHFGATHQKTLILDGTEAVVLSANLTSRYYADTRDMALTDTDGADVGSIEATFDSDFGSTDPDPDVPGAGHNLIWSPTTAQGDLVSLITTAKKTLLVENEELGASVIVDALAVACKRGVQVKLAMTDTNPAYHANFVTLEAAGCGVHIGADDNDTLYIHAKTLVADLGTPDAIGYVGSINFTDASMNRNRELGLYVHDPDLLSQIGASVTGDYNQFPTYSANNTVRPIRNRAPHSSQRGIQ